MVFPWCYPFCNRHAIITDLNAGGESYEFNFNNKHGCQAVCTHVVVSTNPDFREYTLKIALHDIVKVSGQGKKTKVKKV